jgi:HSP20 family protein
MLSLKNIIGKVSRHDNLFKNSLKFQPQTSKRFVNSTNEQKQKVEKENQQVQKGEGQVEVKQSPKRSNLVPFWDDVDQMFSRLTQPFFRNFWSLEPFTWDRDFEKMRRRFLNEFDKQLAQVEGGFDWHPTADVVQTKDGYEITANLPGVSKENIKIEIDGDILTIKGERKLQSEEKDKKYVKRETSYGSFMRRFTLPDNVNTKEIKANYKDGVLKLTIPKAESKEPVTINIE